MQSRRLEQQLNELKKDIHKLPKGELQCFRNGQYIKWYNKIGDSKSYIPKCKRQIAEQLAAKKYYLHQTEEIEQEINYLNKLFKNLNSLKFKSSAMLDEQSNYYELIKIHFDHKDERIRNWLNEEYEHNNSHPEKLKLTTYKGDKVRSKSEVIIANVLFTNKIPYRYECRLQLGDNTIYPDFTIINTANNKIYYWEHYGMMDNSSYCDNTFNKMRLYIMHNIIPGINLITTYETQENPIDSAEIENIIGKYFK